jgi:predicted PurR-regulated permease PerM
MTRAPRPSQAPGAPPPESKREPSRPEASRRSIAPSPPAEEPLSSPASAGPPTSQGPLTEERVPPSRPWREENPLSAAKWDIDETPPPPSVRLGIEERTTSPSPRDRPSSARFSVLPTARESRALEWGAIAAIVVIAWLASPVAAGVLLGALMGFSLQPLHEALERRTRRPLLTSLGTVIGVALVIVSSVGGFGSLFIQRGVALTRTLLFELGPGGSLSYWVESATGSLSKLGISVELVTHKLRDAAAEIASLSATFAETAASGTAAFLLGLFFALVSMYAILRHWAELVRRVEVVSPLRPEYTRSLLEEFQRVGRTTLLGTLLTGIAQGLLATAGFILCGAPEPVFFGIATALASLIPGIGTMLVWAPVGVFLIVVHHPVSGIVELVWGMFVIVGFSDYVLRPRLVGGEEGMPALLTFISLFGGVEVMGLKGLIVGPVAMSIAVATLRIYSREVTALRARKRL